MRRGATAAWVAPGAARRVAPAAAGRGDGGRRAATRVGVEVVHAVAAMGTPGSTAGRSVAPGSVLTAARRGAPVGRVVVVAVCAAVHLPMCAPLLGPLAGVSSGLPVVTGSDTVAGPDSGRHAATTGGRIMLSSAHDRVRDEAVLGVAGAVSGAPSGGQTAGGRRRVAVASMTAIGRFGRAVSRLSVSSPGRCVGRLTRSVGRMAVVCRCRPDGRRPTATAPGPASPAVHGAAPCVAETGIIRRAGRCSFLPDSAGIGRYRRQTGANQTACSHPAVSGGIRHSAGRRIPPDSCQRLIGPDILACPRFSSSPHEALLNKFL